MSDPVCKCQHTESEHVVMPGAFFACGQCDCKDFTDLCEECDRRDNDPLGLYVCRIHDVDKPMKNYFELMWNDQEQFMRLLQEKRGFPEFPVDLSSKAGQKFIKQISYETADELHEARQHLKQKDHRAADVGSVDREEYVEELSDALHFYFELVIASGISKEELFAAYMKKGLENVRRINTGY